MGGEAITTRKLYELACRFQRVSNTVAQMYDELPDYLTEAIDGRATILDCPETEGLAELEDVSATLHDLLIDLDPNGQMQMIAQRAYPTVIYLPDFDTCPECYAVIDDSDEYCFSCGYELIEADEDETS